MKNLTKSQLILLVAIFTMSVFFACSPNNGNGNDEQEPPELPNELKEVKYMDMVSVKGGTYEQTNPAGSFFHTVSDFSIGKYEVTYELWNIVYKWALEHDYSFANKGREGHDGGFGADPTTNKGEPVTGISWRDAVVWCNAYSEIMGYNPVYKASGSVLKDSNDSNAVNCDSVVMDGSANGFRLPTDGEWQYAASKKSPDDSECTPWDWASGAKANFENVDACKKVSWYEANSGGYSHEVGKLDANGLHIYDMSGNVYEWCWDWCGEAPTSSKTDYIGPEVGTFRVGHGGSWDDYSDNLRVGIRLTEKPSYFSDLAGLRVACRKQ